MRYAPFKSHSLARSLSVLVQISRLRPILTTSEPQIAPPAGLIYKSNEVIGRDRGPGGITNSASGQWLESAKATQKGNERKRKRDGEGKTTTTKEDVEIEKDKK